MFGGETVVMEVQRSTMINTLFQAVAKCRFHKVKYYLDRGIGPNVKNDRGHNLLITALHIEDEENRNKMFRYLIKRGADCLFVDRRTGRDVYLWAVFLGRQKQVERILDVTLGDLDLLRADSEGCTALHYATVYGYSAIITLLLPHLKRFHLSVDISDKDGITPYIYAKRLGHLDIANILLNEGNASPRQNDDRRFKSADEWAVVGMKERLKNARKELRKQLVKRKINGKANSKRFKIPKIVVTNPNAISYKVDLQSSINFIKSGRTLHDIDDKNLQHKGHGGRFSMVMINPFLAPQDIKHVKDNPLDAAFTLLASMDTHDFPDHFVQSEFDINKESEYTGIVTSITSFMATLSEQQCEAFREPAKPRKPSYPTIHKKTVEKEKVSSLAILLGKDRKGRPLKGKKKPLSGIKENIPKKVKNIQPKNSAKKKKNTSFLPPIVHA